MLTDIGEYVAGAYLKLRLDCDVVDYNVRPPGGGVKGLGEIDVIGFNLKENHVVLCEVTTHIRGLLYGSGNLSTITRINEKYDRMTAYANENFSKFSTQFMFWSPNVPEGYLTRELEKINGLELVINGEYKKRVGELRHLASEKEHDTRNPFFRMLQIMEHLRD